MWFELIEKIIKYLILFLIGVLLFIVIHKVYKKCIDGFSIGAQSVSDLFKHDDDYVSNTIVLDLDKGQLFTEGKINIIYLRQVFMTYFVYMLISITKNKKKTYVGYTNNLNNRLKKQEIG